MIVRYELHLPSTAERMISISVPSCHGSEQASISYHNPIVVLCRLISLSASQSETQLPVKSGPNSARSLSPAALTCSCVNFDPA